MLLHARAAAEKPEATGERINVSNGRWLELAFCIALDAAGNWSFYYPIGELSDLLFGLVFAFTINLLFNWPMVAAFVRAHVKPGVLARTAGVGRPQPPSIPSLPLENGRLA